MVTLLLITRYTVHGCWALLALLFVYGVMNLLWIAALTAFVLVEKIAPSDRWLARIAGAGLVVWGVYVLGTGSLG